MLRIEHAESLVGAPDSGVNDVRTPSKRYADALWRSNPRLSPDWWREVHGLTLGKLALDWREQCVMPQALAQGCNLVLVSPETWPQACAVLKQQAGPGAFVAVCLSPRPDPAAQGAAVHVWQPPEHTRPEDRRQALVQMEQAVRDGHVEAYGLVLSATAAHPLHLWLQEAAEAAEAVWGRKKRPALRWLVVEQDLLHLNHVVTPLTRHREDVVSTLELAARLGLAVVIVPGCMPQEAAVPAPEAVRALTRVAEAEAALNTHLGGWPHVQGQPLFSVLKALGQGQAPWPTPVAWRAWQAQVWPQMQAAWYGLRTAENAPLVEDYLAAWQVLLPQGQSLATAAVQPVLEHVLQLLHPRLPPVWQVQPAYVQALVVLSALPAVTAVAVAHELPLQMVSHHPGLPDVAAVLAATG